MNVLKKSEGMTLIEVIVAMAIFGIIAVVFLTMFSTSLIWTFRAGDRGIAYTKALSKLENRISEAEDNPDYLYLTFVEGADTVDISIRGRIIESTDTVKQVSSDLDTFVPQMPRIALNPTFRHEGDINRAVVVKGFATNFNSTTKVNFYDSSGINLIAGNIVPTVNNLTELEFNLPLNLLNKEYIVVVTTKINDEPDEIARTKYIVEQPKFIILGETRVYVSADGSKWLNRSITTDWINYDSTDAIFTSYNGTNANSVSSDGKTYIISHNNNLLLSNYNNIWSVSGQSNLNDVNWAGQYSKYYASSNSGVYSSSDRQNWNLVYSTGKSLHGITHGIKNSITQVIAAVGDDGIIVFYDGLNWDTEYIDTDVDFNSISISNNSIIVALGMKNTAEGPKSVIWTATIPIIESDLVWSETYYGDNLNDVYFSPALSQFIAVGDNGKILTSSSGSTWVDLPSSIADGTNLKGVFSNLNEVIIVGDNGKIIYGSTDVGWQVITGTGITEDLLNVSGK